MPTARGVRFSAFSRHATAVTLLLFDRAGDEGPAVEIPLDPRLNRTGDAWHVEVDGIGPGALYLFRSTGRTTPPAAIGSIRPRCSSTRTRKPSPGPAERRKGVVVSDAFDWQGDRPLGRPLQRTVIYETHVRGLTRHPSSGVDHPATFRGVAEKIPYLTDLGVTSVELMPVMEFDDRADHRTNPLTGERLGNYWGYNTIAFFAPKEGYAAAGPPGAPVAEFKEMVRSLHRAGIEVILDIVFNHTAEGDEPGPTLSFRGLDNTIYYLLQTDRGRYANFTGCGNTLNCNHPIVRTLIIDCLRYWVGRDARGRLPLRSRLGARPRPGRPS